MTSLVYAVTKEGIYTQAIVGIYTELKAACDRALEALCAEEDNYHTFDISEFTLNTPVEAGECLFSYNRERVGMFNDSPHVPDKVFQVNLRTNQTCKIGD